MKFTFIVVVLAVLAGCHAGLTLEEAQALCTQQGGLLAVIYTQKITAAGISEPIASPGECISPAAFDANAPAPTNAPSPAN